MFENEDIKISEAVDARKEKIEGEEAWDLLSQAKEVIIGRGKKSIAFQPIDDNKEAILKAALGRTGNLRAPTLKVGKRILVGYNEEMYASHLK